MIVANNLKTEGAGFGTDTNVVTLITKEGQTELPKMTKQEVAHRLLDEIRNRLDFTLNHNKICRIPGAKGSKSDASLLAGGFWILGGAPTSYEQLVPLRGSISRNGG